MRRCSILLVLMRHRRERTLLVGPELRVDLDGLSSLGLQLLQLLRARRVDGRHAWWLRDMWRVVSRLRVMSRLVVVVR